MKLNTGKTQTYSTCPKLPAVSGVKIFYVLIFLFLIKASIDRKFLLHFVLTADVLQQQCSWRHIDKSPVNPDSLQFHQRRLMEGVPQWQNSASIKFSRDSCKCWKLLLMPSGWNQVNATTWVSIRKQKHIAPVKHLKINNYSNKHCQYFFSPWMKSKNRI